MNITLMQMLAAREKRAERQLALLQQFSLPLLSFTLNIVGDVKRFRESDRCFYEGETAIDAMLEREKITVVEKSQTNEATGLELLYVVNIEPVRLKSLMTKIEADHPLGRLFDIDVISPDGRKLSRTEERGCLICGKQGMGCARSRAHSAEEVLNRTKAIINKFFSRRDAEIISKTAVRAILYEVSTSPKPGLVDRYNNGAHRDMDFFTFIDSAVELGSYFRDISKLGASTRNIPLTELLPLLRPIGIQAEKEMLKVTGGVNTHKGLIFSLGIICAVLGRNGLFCVQTNDILDEAGQVAAQALGDFENSTASTHGEQAFAKHGMAGVRKEAANGFPSVREIGLPIMSDRHYLSNDIRGVTVLLSLMAKVADTNVVSRSTPEKLAEIQKLAKNIAKNEDEIIQQAALLDEQLIKENISPGGCADLLAITYFMYFIHNEINR